MTPSPNMPLVKTISERCRVCYTCIRECPAKAIRVAEGQAHVLDERCIGCGNCVRVCSQNAKRVLTNINQVRMLLGGQTPVAAVIAPSFPAEFAGMDHATLVGMIRTLGFDYVNEVAFGADLVAGRYRKLLDGSADRRYIATTCPAIIRFVERYHPEMVDQLAPVVSPMVATARALKRLHGDGLRIVFIGPCIAKKAEAASNSLNDDVDVAITFAELRVMLLKEGVDPSTVQASAFDPPHGGLGRVFAINGGMLQTAGVAEDLLTGHVVTAEGRSSFPQAIRAFENGDLDSRLLEVLCCNGCIMGAGVTNEDGYFARRNRVSQYARQQAEALDADRWRAAMTDMADLDLNRRFVANDQRLAMPSREQITRILQDMGKQRAEDELNCGACGYDTCLEHAIAIHKGLAETDMCLPNTIERIKATMTELTSTNRELAETREQLIQSEKLASMGQLAAGIAHEVNNPLSVVLMYTHLLLEDESLDEKLREDLRMVVDQAGRCRKIVGGLLDFARQNKVVRQPTDVRETVDHALRMLSHPDNVCVSVRHDLDDPIAEIDRDQIIQVLTNLFTNAFAAMTEAGGTLTVRTGDDGAAVRIEVSDTGPGIPSDILGKIFDPFFTTKQIGKGTGLGLAVTYGIVKMHRGDIAVTTNTNPGVGPTGATFAVTLPRIEGDV